MTRSKLLFVLLFCAFFGNAFAQECPKIYRSGDTLKTDPAGGYQWFLNGSPIPNATKQWHLGTVKGNYSVEVSGASPVFTVNNQVKNIFGRIIDERYEPLADAKITVAGKNVLSDAQGVFSLKDLDIKGTTAVLTIEKAGFWKNTQRLTFFDGKEANLTAMLEPLRVTNRFDAQKGATISERGFFLTFPPNSAVKEDGSLYTGTINLSLKRAFPSEEGFGYRMPGGDFSAIDQNGQEKILISYGFMSAEMQGANGEKLNLAKDKEATLEFYIPWEQNKTAPESMPLWHFDEANAVWKPEGTARKVGPRYMGTVKHFSSWNCDVPTGRATVKGTVVNCKGNPIQGIQVTVGQRKVACNVGGAYESFVPAGTAFKVTANNIDSLQVAPLTEGEVRQLDMLTGVFNVIGRVNPTGTLKVYGQDVKEYSIDGGQTFYTKNDSLKIDLQNRPIEGIAKDLDRCESKFRIIYYDRQEDCQLLDTASLWLEPIYRTISDALATNERVTMLGLSTSEITEANLNMIGETFSCIQWLGISSRSNLDTLQLKVLPESVGNWTNIQYLFLTNSQLTTLPESVGNWSNLLHLRLSRNKLISLPESVVRWAKLEHLDLSSNQLTSLTERIGQLSNLQELILGYNQLTSVPESIGQLNKLRALVLNGNRLTSVPEWVGQLSNLQFLGLSENQLTSVPEFIGQLNNLSILWLNGNQLTSLPATIANLKDTLHELHLFGNNFSPEERAKIQSWLPNTNITW